MTMMTITFRRAKEKRLKKDAGRARWGQYFRSLKSSTSPCPMGGDKRVDSDRDSELELDYNHCELKTIFWYIYINTNFIPPKCDLTFLNFLFNSGQ